MRSGGNLQYLAKGYWAKIVSKLAGEDVVRLRDLALQKAWRDTIGGIDVTIGDIALRYPKVNKTLLKWSVDDNFWLRRIAIYYQLSRKKTDPVLLEQIIINNLGQKEFFINKAVGTIPYFNCIFALNIALAAIHTRKAAFLTIYFW